MGNNNHGKQKKTLIVSGNLKAAYVRGWKVGKVQSKHADDRADLRHNLLNRVHSAEMLAKSA